MRIFTPEPDPTPDTGIYAVNGLLSRETWKAVDIVTAGRLPSFPLTFEVSLCPAVPWEDWMQIVFGGHLAPYLIQARESARRGVLELAELDRRFAPHLPRERFQASTRFGLSLLEASLGARHMPEVSKFHRIVASGHAPGHAMTVLALRSSVFGVTIVNGLVACLFCEWVGAQVSETPLVPERTCLQSAFGAATPSLPLLIPSWLQTSGNSAFQSPTGN